MREFICTPQSPVVETKAGKIHGFQSGDTYFFLGIEYAHAERFMRPEPVKPWEGIKTAWDYGYTCPTNSPNSPGLNFISGYRFWPDNENCQYLNVWTGSLEKSAKKPVLVWIHGGAHEQGSAISRSCYDGQDICEYGDIVVVSLTHRLNVLGYLDLRDFGEKYRDSVNVGLYDIVEALKWIKDNIEAFGGDPDNVTIFGHSGGGEKVTTLLQMPAAENLFHKAVVASGVFESGPFDREISNKIMAAMMKKLHTDSISDVEKVPTDQLINSFVEARPELEAEGVNTFFSPIVEEGFSGNGRKAGFTDYAKKIPVMMGTVFAEFPLDQSISDKHNLSYEEKYKILQKKYGEKHLDELLELFRKAFPNKDIGDFMTYDVLFRTPMLDYAEKMSEATDTPIYTFLFAEEFPFDGGRSAWHGSELPYLFHNAHRFPLYSGFEDAEMLERLMSTALVNFVYTGKPDGNGVPEWKPYTKNERNTMVFDHVAELKTNLDEKLQKAVIQNGPEVSVGKISLGKKENVNSVAI